MSTIEKAVSFMEMIARDDSHGYSQYNRDGNPDYDCSRLVIEAWRQAGVPLTCTWTGNMYPDMVINHGFNDVTDGVNIATGEGLKRGDVLWCHNNVRQHTAVYCGNGLEVEAAEDSHGGIGDAPGDQNGREILIREYRPIWDAVLRYPEAEEIETYEFEFQDVFIGQTGAHVNLLQRLLKIEGFYTGDVDSSCGPKTAEAIKNFQQAKIDQGVNVGSGGADGWCGVSTWRAILAI